MHRALTLYMLVCFYEKKKKKKKKKEKSIFVTSA